jgi:cytochrome b pre-mRNA-processing protein 3
MLNLLRKSAARKREGATLHDALVTRARQPVFFTDFGVADSIDGRFDILVFHAWLALAELQARGADLQAQGLTDALFTGFDDAMREQGSGDMGMGRKMKSFANAFYGRLGAYQQAGTERELAIALAKNLWRGAEPDARATRLAAYAQTARAHLRQSLPDALDFGPLPSI